MASWIINAKTSCEYSWIISLLIHNAAAAKAESGGLSLLPRKDIRNVYSSASFWFLYQLILSCVSTPAVYIFVVFCSNVLYATLDAHIKMNQKGWHQIPQ